MWKTLTPVALPLVQSLNVHSLALVTPSIYVVAVTDSPCINGTVQ